MFFASVADPQPVHADPRLPTAAPFTTKQANEVGVSRHILSRLTASGALRHDIRGVYVDATVPDSLDLRARSLSLVVPESAVITDRTAAWLRGIDILAPGDHLVLPPISIVQPLDRTRVRASLASGGVRTLRPDDTELLNGIQVTTALRTALDLGRLVPRDHAIGALDALLRTREFDQSQLLTSISRFKGFRGVRQLRALAPLADGRAESPGESALRLRWLDAGLPRPELQIELFDERRRVRYRGDLGLSSVRFLAEYDGDDFHSTAAQRAHDARRRTWLRAQGWVVVVVRKEHLYGPGPAVFAMLQAGLAQAQSQSASRSHPESQSQSQQTA